MPMSPFFVNVRILIDPSPSIASTAFVKRLMNTWLISPGQQSTTGSSPYSLTTVMRSPNSLSRSASVFSRPL